MPTVCCSHSYCTKRTSDPSGLCAGHRPCVMHWRNRPGLKPPCGVVSMFVTVDPKRVTCPTCRAAMGELWS